MNGCDLMEELARLKEDRDRLTESRERWYGMAKQFAVELTKAKRERDDVQEYADCEKQFADGLKKRIAELEMVLDDERAHCEEFKAEADRAQNDVNLFRKLYERAIRQRDHARKCAEEMRDLYAAEIDESIAAFPFPWEDDNGADRDGE